MEEKQVHQSDQKTPFGVGDQDLYIMNISPDNQHIDICECAESSNVWFEITNTLTGHAFVWSVDSHCVVLFGYNEASEENNAKTTPLHRFTEYVVAETRTGSIEATIVVEWLQEGQRLYVENVVVGNITP